MSDQLPATSALGQPTPPSMPQQLTTQLLGIIPPDSDAGAIAQTLRDPKAQQLIGALWDAFSSSVVVEHGDTGDTEKLKLRVGRTAGDWADQMDAGFAGALLTDAKKDWYRGRDEILAALHPGWRTEDREALAKNARFSFERLVANALMWDRTKALKVAQGWLANKGVATSGAVSPEDRAYGDAVSEIYRMASDNDPESPWRGMGDAGDNMRAMLGVLEQGGGLDAVRRSGGTTSSGTLTDAGKAALRESMNNAGSTVQALRELTGASKATDALLVAANPNVLGARALKQLTNPDMAGSLRTYNRMAKLNGMTPQGRVTMLGNLRKFVKSGNVQAALKSGIEVMSIGALAESRLGGVGGDPAKIQQLSVMAMDRARRDPRMKVAAAAAAALEPVYGKMQAWNIADMSLKGARNANQVLARANRYLPRDRRMNAQAARDLTYTPQAGEYFNSGRPVAESMYNAVVPMSQFIRNHSYFLNKFGTQILRDRGSLDTATIANWMGDKGYSNRQVGQVMRHLQQFGPAVARRMNFPTALSTDDVLGFISAVGRRKDRREAVDRAYELAGQQRQMQTVHADRGVAAVRQGVLQGQGLKALPSFITGTDTTVRAENLPAVPRTPPVGIRAKESNLPGKVRTEPRKPASVKVPNMTRATESRQAQDDVDFSHIPPLPKLGDYQ